MVDTGEQVPMDRQVRILLNGIRDPRLQSAVNTILSTQSLRSDFDAAINHMAQVLDMHTSYKSQSNNSNRQISSVSHGQAQGRGRGGRGRGRGGRSGRGGRGRGPQSLTDRYYTPEEWNALTPEQREQVRSRRNERDRRRGVAAIHQATTQERNTRQRSEEHGSNTPQLSNNNNNSNTPSPRSRPNNLGSQATQRASRT